MIKPTFTKGEISSEMQPRKDVEDLFSKRFTITTPARGGGKSYHQKVWENAAHSARHLQKVQEDAELFGTGFYWQGDDATITRITPDAVRIGESGEYEVSEKWRKPCPGKLETVPQRKLEESKDLVKEMIAEGRVKIRDEGYWRKLYQGKPFLFGCDPGSEDSTVVAIPVKVDEADLMIARIDGAKENNRQVVEIAKEFAKEFRNRAKSTNIFDGDRPKFAFAAAQFEKFIEEIEKL